MPASEGNINGGYGYAQGGYGGADVNFVAEKESQKNEDINKENKPETEIIQPYDLKEGIELNLDMDTIEKEGSFEEKDIRMKIMPEEAPELENGEEEIALTDKDIEECKAGVRERAEKDYIDASHTNIKTSIRDGWKEPRLTEVNEAAKLSAETWAETRMASDLKDILDEKKAKQEKLEVGDVKWNRMAKEVEQMIKKKDWKKIIPRVGSMNNLDPQKFKETILPLFNDTDYKEGVLNEVQEARESAEGIGRDINPWELASTIRYVSECFPELRNDIKFSGKDWNVMKKYLSDVRKREWGVKELAEFGEKSEYWKVKYLEKNMKIIEKMIDDGDIKVSKENDIKKEMENDKEKDVKPDVKKDVKKDVKNNVENNTAAEQK